MQPSISARLLWRNLPRAASRCTSSAPAPAPASAPASASCFSTYATKSATPLSSHLLRSSRRAFQLQQQSQRAYSSSGIPPKGGIKFWPFLVILGLCSGAYTLLVKQRATEAASASKMPAVEPPKSSGQLPAPSKPAPTFSPDTTTVIFVLGGPGAGKGTQCANLVQNHGFTHLSAGDLLRAEQDRPGSQFGQLIRDYIKDGLIVPMEVTVQLLENAMADTIRAAAGPSPKKEHRFLIDGFPRKMDQAFKFEEAVCPARLVLFYDCPEAVMEARLLERGKTSGRSDDNAESIRKRFRTFVDTSMPVVDHYDSQGRVVKVDATAAPDVVYKKTVEELKKKLGDKF
ncbi:UMP-CMP kinase [Sodiomyces alkalinus F11]|uniref:Uridylate kinase n=1 Tax=Sodiomyces alkalinus (strain CBS 110278 / VKM F-3762 / F11) TaxID=1314773 RepID=A0A3N2PQW4_SODAK|nr:UMP-CMP kinase [Sodiomyces alkalinus F11]ROT36844.1 UMP-CMP kinase [Sodiomyces alkalinus F11]